MIELELFLIKSGLCLHSNEELDYKALLLELFVSSVVDIFNVLKYSTTNGKFIDLCQRNYGLQLP